MPNPNFPYIQHVFVLMLENRSFDHLLGFSGINGTDAEHTRLTKIEGLTGDEFNEWNGRQYKATPGAPGYLKYDPRHEFEDAFYQLTGQQFRPGMTYDTTPINNSGFVADYARLLPPGTNPDEYGDVMKCYTPEQLPVLNFLAREYAVCDHWFSSLPGPTWPNRFFVHAGSSGGLDHSPKPLQSIGWEALGGLKFQHGTVFDELRRHYDDGFIIYRGDRFLTDHFPIAGANKGIGPADIRPFSNFERDVNRGDYQPLYTFIEPSYGDLLSNSYFGGTSQHPCDSIAGGEQLIKTVYEAIRRSPLWEKSLLIITWDEHGGFYDHVAPPPALSPADTLTQTGNNQNGFNFKRYGVRVPAVIISPKVGKNVIDHRVYDHSSISRTLQRLFALDWMTPRDKNAQSLMELLILNGTFRSDCPMQTPDPATFSETSALVQNAGISTTKGSLPGFLHAALKTDLELSPEEEHPLIMAKFAQISTLEDAREYMNEVKTKIDAHEHTNI